MKSAYMRRRGIVIIGTGRIAAVHALSVRRNPALELTGFVNEFEAGDLPQSVGVPCFPSLATAVERLRPEGLVIASPTATHVEYLKQALGFGLPSLCEKPVALTRQPIAEAVEAVRIADIPVILGFHRRFDPYRREVKDKIGQGLIGSIEHLLQISRDPRLPDRGVIAHQGGIVADMIIHDLDELLWLVGRPPERVHAALANNVDKSLAELDDHDSVAVQLEWEDGPVAHITATRRAAHGFEQRLEVFGSQGRLICGDPMTSPVVFDGAEATCLPRRHEHFPDRYQAAYQAEIDHLASLLAGRAAPISTILDGLNAFDLLERVNAAAGRLPVSEDLPAAGRS
ncbi:Gfo/Idh/MocA family oxidoreductase [Mesorhizobium sp. M0862]|uniref:Gfo/Idh/MocA family protein n=1 Tax=Mesorhizobium sp. M0862 TaxID=2957015 RepID=UPI00333815BE